MKRLIILLFVLLLLGNQTSAVFTQEQEELTLSMSRDFGYSSGTGDIQGTFSMKASGPDTLVRVEFFIDDTLIAEDNEAPYKVQFVTDNYPLRSTCYKYKGVTNIIKRTSCTSTGTCYIIDIG